MPTPPGFLLDLTFHDLSNWRLHLECCGRVVCIPFRQLAAQKPTARLGDILRALRCRDCGRRPARVALANDGADEAGGGTGTEEWRIGIVFPDAPV